MGTGKTLGNTGVSAAVAACTASPWAVSASSVRQQNLVEVSVVQLNARKDLRVDRALIHHGSVCLSVCLWSIARVLAGRV